MRSDGRGGGRVAGSEVLDWTYGRETARGMEKKIRTGAAADDDNTI